MDSLLAVSQLKTYFTTANGVTKAVDGVSFDLHAGQTLAIVGESGSGKSVSMLSLLGLLPRSRFVQRQGSAIYAGQDLLTMPAAALRRLRGTEFGMIFQDPMTALNPYLTVATQLTEVLTAQRLCSHREAMRRAEATLAAVGLPDPARQLKAYPHQLSGGMRQRVMIAIAIIAEPKILIADEPTTALDVTVQAQILELLGSLQKERGMGLIMVTHDLGVVAGLADDILVMYAGRIVESGKARNVLKTAQHPYTQGLLRSVPRIDGPVELLVPIPGLPPDPARLPVGCAFAPRCALVRPVCLTPVAVPVRAQADGRISTCHLELEATYV